MKKILIIEDDQLVANVYRNKFLVENYQVEIAADGENGMQMVQMFRPDVILLDLILPGMSGVEVIKQVRATLDFARTPIIVLSNTYLTNMIQEVWRAGATKCLSKINCSPKEVLDIVRQTTGGVSAPKATATPQPRTAVPNKTPPPTTPAAASPAPVPAPTPAPVTTQAHPQEEEANLLTDLRESFVESLPPTILELRSGLQSLTKTGDDVAQPNKIHELHQRIHELAGNAGLSGYLLIARFSTALEALLKEIYEKPKNINTSTLRTVAAAVDFLDFLFEHGRQPGNQEIPHANILVVEDDPIAQRAVVYALEKAQLRAFSISDPNLALQMLTENNFYIVFLDVNMPGMTGFELCSKLRALPRHKKTPVIFVTVLSDFESRSNSMMAGGNDFIVKPFLSIELTVKALMHVLRGKLQPVK